MEVQEHLRYHPIIGVDLLNDYNGRLVRYQHYNDQTKTFDIIVGRLLLFDNNKNLITIKSESKKTEQTFPATDYDQIKLIYPREQYYASHGKSDKDIGRNTTVIPENAHDVTLILGGKKRKSKKLRKSKKSKKLRKLKKSIRR